MRRATTFPNGKAMKNHFVVLAALVAAFCFQAHAATPVNDYCSTNSGTTWTPCVPIGSGTQPVSGTVAATQSGTWTVQPGNTANTTPWLFTGGSQAATYATGGTGYAAYATPTDLLVVKNPVGSGKVVYVVRLSIYIEATASALQQIYYIKRSTVNTGGTSTNPALVAYDSNSPAPVSVLDLYTAAPTLGTAIGTLRVEPRTNSVLAAGGSQIDIYSSSTLGTTVAINQPVTLRAGESLAINYNGAALTAGFAAQWNVEVVER